MIKIGVVTSATAKDLKDINALLPQLSQSAKPLTLTAYRALLKNKSLQFAAARENGRIVGIATLIYMHSPTFTAGYVSDVVVDEAMRGKGLGRKLMQTMIALSKKAKVDMMEFTSKPSRVAANKLYQSMGFELRETNVYRMKFKK